MSRFICRYAESLHAECHYAECHVLFAVFRVRLNVVMLSVVAPVPVHLVEQSNHDPESEASNPPALGK